MLTLAFIFFFSSLLLGGLGGLSFPDLAYPLFFSSRPGFLIFPVISSSPSPSLYMNQVLDIQNTPEDSSHCRISNQLTSLVEYSFLYLSISLS
jgi:hypothetical protein